MNGGRFDFDDGGTYCGGWEDGKANGHGVCTGPKGQGEYAGAWHYGFEVSGTYVWPSGNTFSGQWQNGRRHGLGVETRGRWMYRGEWTTGYKGRYGVRQSTNSQAKYAGTWSAGLQDGYGCETYADAGSYQGQWLRGMRHGYGIRKSAAYGVAAKFRSRSHAHASLTSLRSEQGHGGSAEPLPAMSGDDDNDNKNKKLAEECRGGFVLRSCSAPPARRRRSLSERTLAMKQTILSGLRIKKQKSTGDITTRVNAGSVRSSGSTMSCASDDSEYDTLLPPDEHVDVNATETYMGEWKNDKRSGFGISERSDGLKYEGEWFNNKKFGYGCTTLRDGTKEEGKYKNNILVTSQRKKHLLFVRSSKLRERVDAACQAASRAAQIALQKADIALSRMSTARDRADQADFHAQQGAADADLARIHSKQFDPSFNVHTPSQSTLPMRPTPLAIGNHIPSGSQPVLPINPAVQAIQQYSLDEASDGGYDQGPSTSAGPTMVYNPMTVPGASNTLPNEPVINIRTPMIAQIGPQQSSTSMSSQPGVNWPNPPVQPPPVRSRLNTVDVPEQAPSSRKPSVALSPVKSQDITPVEEARSPTPELKKPVVRVSSGPKRDDTMPHTSSTSPNELLPDDEEDEEHMQCHNVDGHRCKWNDHFEQYVKAANPSSRQPSQKSRGAHAPVEASLSTSKAEVVSQVTGETAAGLTRRTTLSSNRDYMAPHQLLPPKKSAEDAQLPSTSQLALAAPPRDMKGAQSLLTRTLGDDKGSLPDLHAAAKVPVVLSREEVARMSSQRRQEVIRVAEERELLEHNPLRYLFHPAVRAWVIRWKLPIMVALVNVCLSIIFYQLLSFTDDDDDDADDDLDDR